MKCFMYIYVCFIIQWIIFYYIKPIQWLGHKYWLGLQQTQTGGHENQGCDQALKAYFLLTLLMQILPSW